MREFILSVWGYEVVFKMILEGGEGNLFSKKLAYKPTGNQEVDKFIDPGKVPGQLELRAGYTVLERDEVELDHVRSYLSWSNREDAM